VVATASAQQVDVYFLLDDSGSMYVSSGDPKAVRRAAALSVVQLLGAGPSGSRVCVIHWGSSAPSELVLRPTAVRHTAAIKKGLEIPPTLGGNNFPAALQRCREVLEVQGSGDRTSLIFPITDGIEEVGAAAAAEVSLLPPTAVHVLLVDHSHGCVPNLEARWASLPLGSFTRLDVLDTRQMAWQIAQVVARAVGTEMPPLPTPSSST